MIWNWSELQTCNFLTSLTLKVFILFLSSARISWLALFYLILSLISSCGVYTCDAKDDAELPTWHWSFMEIRYVENFDLEPTICLKRKEDGVSSRGERGWWPKQVTIVGVSSKRDEEGSVCSRAGEEKGRVIVNSLITGVTFGEIVLSGLEVSMNTLSVMAILNGFGQLAATCP